MIIKLVGGPMNGRTVEIDDDAEEYRVSRLWRYTWTNSMEAPQGSVEGKIRLFALASESRPVQRAVRWFIEKWGQHPAMYPKTQPFVKKHDTGRNALCRCGSGQKNKRCCNVD